MAKLSTLIRSRKFQRFAEKLAVLISVVVVGFCILGFTGHALAFELAVDKLIDVFGEAIADVTAEE